MATAPLMNLLAAALLGMGGWTPLQHRAAADPTQPMAQAPPPSSAPGPSQPSAPGAADGAAFLIVPGQSLGPVRLGTPVREEMTRLGPTKSSAQLGDGTRMYRWFEPPTNTGIGVRANQNGLVLMVWVLNDARYTTKEGLHVGSTEAEVTSALGAPTRVESNLQDKTKTLVYDALGLWFGIQLDPRLNFYNTVFDIGVMARSPQAPPLPSASIPPASPPPAVSPRPASPPAQTPSPPATPPAPAPTPAPPAAVPAPPAPTAPPATPAPDNRSYTVRVGLSNRDRASATAKQLQAGGFPQANVTSQAGFRVVSEPLPRSVTEGLLTTLAGRGFHGEIEPLTGDTVQVVFGAFATQKDADVLAQRVTAAGYDAWVRAGTVYVLQLGPYPQTAVKSITDIVKAGAPEATVTAEPAP